MDLVLDIGNFRFKGALFEGNALIDSFNIPVDTETLKSHLQDKFIASTLISSVNRSAEAECKKLFEELKLPFNLLDFSSVKVTLDVEDPAQVSHGRIANIYGALHHFPQNDCIVVDLGTAAFFDYIGSDGRFSGGAIFHCEDKIPLFEVERPESALAKTTKASIQSGIYWGLLGAIERITSELRQCTPNPSNVMIIATGDALQTFSQDLIDLVDLIDPHLTLIGLHEILTEKEA